MQVQRSQESSSRRSPLMEPHREMEGKKHSFFHLIPFLYSPSEVGLSPQIDIPWTYVLFVVQVHGYTHLIRISDRGTGVTTGHTRSSQSSSHLPCSFVSMEADKVDPNISMISHFLFYPPTFCKKGQQIIDTIS